MSVSMSMPFGRRISLFRLALGVLLALLAAASAATLLAPWFWLADLLTFFRPHLFGASLIALALALLSRRRWPILAAAALALFNLWPLAVAAAPSAPRAAAGAPTVRIMSANLLNRNPRKDLFQRAVAQVAPDVLVVQEDVFAWPMALGRLPGFPYRASDLDRRLGAIDVLSRLPMKVTLIGAGPGNVKSRRRRPEGGVRAEIEVAPGAPPLVVYAIHPLTPRSERWWRRRAASFAEIARHIRAEPEGTRIVVAGDWNTPPWSPQFARFMDEAGLQATEALPWPAATRIFSVRGHALPRWLGTPVDRLAVKGGVAVAGLRFAPAFGSDHLPIYADLTVR
ncbi:endonuclease/exonuclease/phosphatase family protein [Xanthobacter sp. KR7-225]|uniref:endonuclease/exonuclease/phosphatase family protein n=1 Tax=Xanthobacter sp. KR7-225 TaxID=3156613 RepID=UPI0032B40BCE